MFCPSCGRNNVAGTRFCVTCGTNLEVVSQALLGNEEDFFTRIDAGFDLFIARYSEHVFKNAPVEANERTIKGSWKLLGEGAITSLVDLILFSLIWNFLPLRFLILLISTPIRMLYQRGNRKKQLPGREDQESVQQQLASSMPEKWLMSPPASVSEHTTERLAGYEKPEMKEPPNRE